MPTPNLTRGLAQLSNSIFASLGVSGLADEMAIGESPSGRECFVLIDGMGQAAIDKYGSYFPIFAQFLAQPSISSYFPSTTAVSLSSIGTGVLPGVHGMLGYTVRVPRSGEPGRLLNSLKWDERVDPVIWQSTKTLFERATQHGVSVTHVAAKRYEGSGFTQAALRGATYLGANQIADIANGAAASLKKSPSYAYVYINHLDAAGHDEGVGSEKWFAACLSIEELLKALLHKLPKGTRIWVTSDHGMVNVAEKIILGQDNSLMNNVTLVGGEPRARHIYLREGSEQETAIDWREQLGEYADIYTRTEAIAAGLFGAEVSLDSSERMGDLIAIAKGGAILIDPTRVSQESAMVGHHGGLETAETSIPLFTQTI
ncbi:unannotated protein [freshwater metagenome]|uniref:Unannotated protein n=1 Tax=freshwater metagenome TaxID=449393 RepID=A0A6J6HX38_9ZZZZ